MYCSMTKIKQTKTLNKINNSVNYLYRCLSQDQEFFFCLIWYNIYIASIELINISLMIHIYIVFDENRVENWPF